MHEHQSGQDAGPGKLGMIGRQVEVHLGTVGCIVKSHHSSPATDLVEGENRDGDSCNQHQDRLNNIGIDDCLEASQDGVAGSNDSQGDDEPAVVGHVHKSFLLVGLRDLGNGLCSIIVRLGFVRVACRSVRLV